MPRILQRMVNCPKLLCLSHRVHSSLSPGFLIIWVDRKYVKAYEACYDPGSTFLGRKLRGVCQVGARGGRSHNTAFPETLEVGFKDVFPIGVALRTHGWIYCINL